MNRERNYFAIGNRVFWAKPDAVNVKVADAISRRLAKRIANALNIYKVRRRKSAEKASESAA